MISGVRGFFGGPMLFRFSLFCPPPPKKKGFMRRNRTEEGDQPGSPLGQGVNERHTHGARVSAFFFPSRSPAVSMRTHIRRLFPLFARSSPVMRECVLARFYLNLPALVLPLEKKNSQMARDAAARASRPGGSGSTGMGLLMGQYLDSRPLPGGHYLAGLAGCPRGTAQEVRYGAPSPCCACGVGV